MRLVIVPRWSGHADSDFYPWLRAELGARFDEITMVPLQPDAGAPTIEASVEALQRRLGTSVSDTVLLGHSVGCQVIMRALERLDSAVAGCSFVAGWFEIDKPWASIQPWIDRPIDDPSVRRSAGSLRVLLSTNDPFTSDHEGTRSAFESRLGAQVRLVPDRAHFNSGAEPEVLAELDALLVERGPRG